MSNGAAPNAGVGEQRHWPIERTRPRARGRRAVYRFLIHSSSIFSYSRFTAAHAHDPRQEEAAFRIAWAAVKREYEKIGDEWVEKR